MIGVHGWGLGRGHLVVRYIGKIRNVEKTKSAYVVNAFFVVFF